MISLPLLFSFPLRRSKDRVYPPSLPFLIFFFPPILLLLLVLRDTKKWFRKMANDIDDDMRNMCAIKRDVKTPGRTLRRILILTLEEHEY